MSEKILVPELGESITEATLAKWLKKKGDTINADEPVVELETEKVNLEVPSPITGVVSEVNFKNGGDSFMITLKDDGGGIDPSRVKKIAQEKGLKSKTDLEKMNDSDLLNMIFIAGFSTKEEVTDISGRGIGMDAVKESIDLLGGEISISSKIDEGTTFFIKLPKVS